MTHGLTGGYCSEMNQMYKDYPDATGMLLEEGIRAFLTGANTSLIVMGKEKFLISCMGDNLSNWKNNGFPACEIEIMLTDEEKEDLKNEYEYYEEDCYHRIQSM